MADVEHFDVVILGSGQGGKQLAWHLGRSGKKVATVEAPLGRRFMSRCRLLALQERALERAGRAPRQEC